jgi:H-type lectin domain
MVIGAVGSSAAAGAMMKSGTTGNVGPAANQTTFGSAVSFGATFPAPPNVYINQSGAPGGSGQWNGRAISITTTGFTLQGYGPASAGAWSSPWQWTAIYQP